LTTEDSSTARLFLALWPSLAVRRALVVQQARWAWPAGAAPTAANKLHLTLHFIGAVPAARLVELTQGLRVRVPRSTLVLDTAELWPNHCAVLCPSQVPAPLVALHGALAQALRARNLPVETRPFRPHVTLARNAAGVVPPAQPTALYWPVRAYALVQSAGGRYTPIARYR
jgi:RNA 2',3'-cyclic 3'-phosphodiesterase